MPNFSNQAPPQGDRHGYRLVRTPAGSPFRAYVLSDRLIGCPTHYVGNRTVPCEDKYCEACENGIGWRWHGYLLVQIEATTEVVIFEMTAAASDAFKAYYERHGTTRGCHFQAKRANNRTNGRVLITAKPADLAKVTLPKAVDVGKLLSHIWNIPPNQVNKAPAQTRPPADTIAVDRALPEIFRPAPATYEHAPPTHPEETTDGNGRNGNFTAKNP